MAIECVMPGGKGGGEVAQRLLEFGGDWNCLRPWRSRRGHTMMTLNVAPSPGARPRLMNVRVENAQSTMEYDEWKYFDDAVVEEALPEQRLWADLVSQGCGWNLPDAMSVTVIQQQTMLRSGNATISMNGLRTANRSRPIWDTTNFPIPLVHSDFSFDYREILESRRRGIPLDDAQIREATRQCVREIELITQGTRGSYTYGGGTIYGLTNHPDKISKVITSPTASGWTPQTTYDEILDALQALQDVYFNRNVRAYYSPGWTKYLNTHFTPAYNAGTLRQQLGAVDGISGWVKLDELPGYQIILVETNKRTIRCINGMPLKTIQWGSHGDFQFNYKVVGIMVPQIRSNANGNTGIVHMAPA